MKLPTPRKLPSGSWFVRVKVNGIEHSITRPTEKECLAEAAAIKAGKPADKKIARETMTVSQAIDRYILKRQKVRSPSTIRGYRMIQKHYFPGLMPMQVSRLTEDICQQAVNDELDEHSAKTVKNAWGLVSSALKESVKLSFSVALPTPPKNEHDFLTAQQIPVFLKAVYGERIELSALLALHSLRRSEILDLSCADINLQHDLIRVHGAAVYDENGILVHKETNKTSNSARVVPIMIPRLRELLEAAVAGRAPEDYVCTLGADTLYHRVNAICAKAGLPEVGAHGLRHSYASLAFSPSVNLPIKTAMVMGGWDDEVTMMKIYDHVSAKDISDAAAAMSGFYSSL